MSETNRADDPQDPHPQSRTQARDALAFMRIGGDAAVSYFQAADEEGAARALLLSYPVPAVEQRNKVLKRRSEECSTALPSMGIHGYSKSIQTARGLLYLFLAAVAVAGGWLLVSFFGGDPNADPFLFPAEIIFLPVEEILLLAPFALIVLYVPAHLAALWQARTTAQAVLQWATGDDEAQMLGIPAKSPFAEIADSWLRLQFLAGAVVLMDAFLAVFLGAVRRSDEPYGLFLLPALCALPFIAVYLFCGGRARVAQRRHALVADRLYRVPAEEEVSLPEEASLDGLYYPADVEEDPLREKDEETVLEDTEWKKSF